MSDQEAAVIITQEIVKNMLKERIAQAAINYY